MSTQTYHFANFLAFNINPSYAAIVEKLGELTGYATSFGEGHDFNGFANGTIDAAFICGLPYTKMTEQAQSPFELIAAPVLSHARYQDRPVYFSDVIVQANSQFQTFEDLQGCTFTYNEPVSHSGYHTVRYFLEQQGRSFEYFGRMYKSGAHLNSVEHVASGQAEAAAIDSHALDFELNAKPELRQKLRIVQTIGPSPIPPVVVATHLPQSVKDAFKQALLTMHTRPEMRAAMSAGCIARFTEVDDGHYDYIRQVRATDPLDKSTSFTLTAH